MLTHVHSARLFAAIIFGISCLPVPAFAIDCTKAKTPVEVAICTDDHLGDMDDQLSTEYFALLRDAENSYFQRDGVGLHDALRADQKKWLAQRNSTCNAEVNDRVIACVSDSITSRETALREIGQPTKGDTLRIGSETVVVGLTDYVVRTLEYHGKPIVEAGGDLNPFMIVDKWSSPDADAVLLNVEDGGTLRCSSPYVLAVSKGSLNVHEFGQYCPGGFGEESGGGKTKNGFVWSRPSTPIDGGSVTEWDARSGAVTTKQLTFRPKSGTTMRDLVTSKKPAEQEPLDNQEFFDAVNKLPVDYKKRVMASLWNVTEDCPLCLDNAGRKRYGVSIDPDLVLYSGCGWNMEGAHLNCFDDDDALGLWDRKSGAFFFALRPQQSGRPPITNAEVYVHPPLAEWPQIVRQKFELWQSGADLVKRDK